MFLTFTFSMFWRTLLAGFVIGFALGVIFMSRAYAELPADICAFKDNDGHMLEYDFGISGPVMPNKTRSLPEIGFTRDQVAPPNYVSGKNWTLHLYDNGMTTQAQNGNPDWIMVFSTGHNNIFPVVLMKKGEIKAIGQCALLPPPGPGEKS